MANFTALKTAINNAIKTNGNEEITGAILQAILDAMVETLGDSAINDLENAITTEVTNRENAVGGVADDLAAEVQARQALDYNVNNRINAEEYNRQNADAALSQTMSQGFQTLGSQMTALNAAISALNAAYQNGYLYGGIATPSSSPSNNKCFYIALQGGTYTNFGGVGVVQGINILKNDNGWKVEHIYDQTTLLNEFYLLRQQVIQAITSFAPIVIEGDVTNAPDEEDLTSNAQHLLQFKNNAYSPLEFSGLGRKYLRKNIAPLSESAAFNGFVEGVTAEETLSGTPEYIFWDRMNTRFVGIKDGVYYADWSNSDNYVPASTSLVYMYQGTPYRWDGSDFSVDEAEVPNLVNCLTQDMINEANTIYIIRYDYTLKEDITIPEGCVLQFEGGSISGEQTLTFQNTYIGGQKIKIDCSFNGSIKNTEVDFDWFNPEMATWEQYTTFLNTAGWESSWGSVPTISQKNSTILSTLFASAQNIIFGKGIYMFDTTISNNIPSSCNISGAGMHETLLWFPQSAALGIGNTNLAKIQEIGIEAWGNCLHINASNAVQFLQLINCHLVSYNDNVVERVKNSGPVWGSDFASCHAGTCGSEKSCFLRINSTTNNYWHCSNAAWFWNGPGLLRKGNRIKAFWYNSTFFADKCGFDTSQLEYICYEDTDSELAGYAPWSLSNITIEGTQDISNGLNGLIFTVAPRRKRLYWNNIHSYGAIMNNPTYGYALVVNNNVGDISIWGDFNDVVWGLCQNHTSNPIVAANQLNINSSPQLTYIMPFAGDAAAGAYQKYFVFQPSKNADAAKAYFPTVSKTFIEAVFAHFNGNYAYLMISALPNQTIIIGKALYRMSDDGSALIGTLLENNGSGTTTNRPTNPSVGFQYFDTTLNKPIWYKGSNVWVDAIGATV